MDPNSAPGEISTSAASGLSSSEAAQRLTKFGTNSVAEVKSSSLLVFARKFWGLSAWMIELIAIVSLILHKWPDVWIALALLIINAVLSFIQERHASAAVEALRSKLQTTARVLRDGAWQSMSAIQLVPGDIVRVRAGDFVPADAKIIIGSVDVDQSALTGESRQISKSPNDPLYSGTVIAEGEATAVITSTGPNTYFGRTTQLVQSARPKLHVEEVISRVVKWLFLIVGLLVAAATVASLVEGFRFLEILPLSLVLLMSAVPVALPVMFTVSMTLGSMELVRRGVLVTRLSAAEDAANMNVLCADKTGTLTVNRLSFVEGLPRPAFTAEDVLRIGALASDQADQDPIDVAFLEAAGTDKRGTAGKLISFIPFSPKTRRTEATFDNDGKQSLFIKGALSTVASAAGLDEAAIRELESNADKSVRQGGRIIAVACADEGQPLQLVGLAILRDSLRPESLQLMDELRRLGLTIKMLTGDALPVAQAIGSSLGLNKIVRAPKLRSGATGPETVQLVNQSDGFAEVFPEDKFLVVKSLQAANHIVGMTGDGVNDAPALRQAEVGIAVSGATDVAKSAASVVLTTEGLSGIVDLVKGGRAIYQRVLTWIVNKVSRTILKSGFVVVAFLATGRFVISAVGMMLLVFITDFAKIALSTDFVRPSNKPDTWNIGPLVTLAAILGLLMLGEALGLLAIGWRQFDLARHPGQLATFTFQTLLFLALFSIVSIRERRVFWSSFPSPVFSAALFGEGLIGLAVGRFGMIDLDPLPWNATLLVVTCSIVSCLGLNEGTKLLYLLWLTRSGRNR